MNNPRSITPSPNHRIAWPDRYLGIVVFLAFLAIYVRTAAPSVLSGDSAELQMAAATLGVAHPTTYPLYTLLGHAATLLVPFGDLAWRVTLLTAGCAALAVGLFCALALRLGVSRRAALIGTLALGVSPGLWNAATAAEVYALLAVLMVALAYVVSYQLSAFSFQESAIGVVGAPPSGARSQESGVRSQESGVRSQESGVRSQEPGARRRRLVWVAHHIAMLACSLVLLLLCSLILLLLCSLVLLLLCSLILGSQFSTTRCQGSLPGWALRTMGCLQLQHCHHLRSGCCCRSSLAP